MKMIVISVMLAAVMMSGCQSASVTGPSADVRAKAELAAQDEKYDLSKFE